MAVYITDTLVNTLVSIRGEDLKEAYKNTSIGYNLDSPYETPNQEQQFEIIDYLLKNDIHYLGDFGEEEEYYFPDLSEIEDDIMEFTHADG